MRPSSRWAGLAVLVILASACVGHAPPETRDVRSRYTQQVTLPEPDTTGSVTLEAAIQSRRSLREFRSEPVPLGLIGQLLWAAQGITDEKEAKRAAPSAGATYPLELYVVTPTQVMHYLPEGHRMEVRPDADRRSDLETAAFGQSTVADAPAVIVVAAVFRRTRTKYGALAEAFVNREAGHATQNMLLEATASGLAAVPIGGIDGNQVKRILALPPDEDVLYLVPIGYPPEAPR